MEQPLPPLPPTLVAALADRYRLERELGRGGMATVYLAHDLKHGRKVAIKVLNPELVASGQESDRFLREIRTAARLSHPGILPLHDSGSRDGILFFVMPYVAGPTLRGRLQAEGRLPIEEAIRVARKVATALDYAHRQNVLHRDIKPENILLHERQPVLSDFGIARAITAAAGEHVTERSIAIGTPSYMSPEQATAEREMDGRSDVYALACVLYEMLSGEPPFQGGTSQSILLRHLTERPAGLQQRRPGIPPGVELAVLRALAKDPSDRFDTAGDFSSALIGPPPSVAGPERPAAARGIAVLPFVNASPDLDNEYLSDGLTDELINALANVEGLRVAPRTSVFALKGRREDVRTLGAELGVSTVLEGSVRRSGSKVRITTQLSDVAEGRLLWSERYDRQLDDIFALEEEIAGTIVGTLRGSHLGGLETPTPRRYTENLAAWQLYLRGRYAWNKRTREGIAEAVRLFEQAAAADPGYALAYSGLADCHAIEVDYRGVPVAEGMRKAREEARHALELDEGLAEAHTSLAWVLFIHDWEWETARRHFVRAIDLNPRYATARQWYSWYLMAMGHAEEAFAQGRLARDLDPASTSVQRSLGWLYYYASRTEEAIAQLRLTLSMNPASEETQWVLGLALLQGGQLEEAEQLLRQAEQAVAGANHHAYASLVDLAVQRGRRAEALAAVAALHEVARERYVSPVDFARMYLALGDTDRVFEWIERAWEERRGWLVYLKVEPSLAAVRSDERFDRLLHRMRLD